MTAVLPQLSPEHRTELEAWEQHALSHEQFEARVRAPWTAQELEDFDNLIGWFNRRYPTAGERLRERGWLGGGRTRSADQAKLCRLKRHRRRTDRGDKAIQVGGVFGACHCAGGLGASTQVRCDRQIGLVP